MPDGHDENAELGPEPWAEFAEKLRQAHRDVARRLRGDELREQVTKQLLVITNLAKHDVVSASKRLDAFLAQLWASDSRGDFRRPRQ